MTEDQAFQAIKNAIRLENLGRKTAAKVTPEILRILQEVKREVMAFPGPSDAIARQIRYKQFELRLASIIRPLGDTFYQELIAALGPEVELQVRWAKDFLDTAEKAPASQAIAMAGQDGIGVQPALGTGPVGQTFVPQITRTQLYALADETEVLGKRLVDLFGWGSVEKSPYTESTFKKIDQVVKRGFLLGETNEEIARNLVVAQNGMIRDSRAIARTAVMDMSQRAHNRFWDANNTRIALWEFDATFDYRVCPQCYPYDGKRRAKRSDLPSVPRHPNCRCRILPVTGTQLALEKEEMAEGMTMSTVQVGSDKGTGRGPVRRYKTKAKVNGKRMPKFAKDYEVPRGERPTMALFLRRANDETRRAVLGAENARRFSAYMKDDKMDEVEALQQIIRNPSRRRRKR